MKLAFFCSCGNPNLMCILILEWHLWNFFAEELDAQELDDGEEHDDGEGIGGGDDDEDEDEG